MLIALPGLASDLPHPRLTPGHVRSTSREEICSTRTSTVRAVSAALKERVRKAYGLKSRTDGVCAGPEGCEIDHLIPLGIGGSNDPLNLWPQGFAGRVNAHQKDRLEYRLHLMVCSGKLDVATAQRAIASDWVAAARKYLR